MTEMAWGRVERGEVMKGWRHCLHGGRGLRIGEGDGPVGVEGTRGWEEKGLEG